MKSKVGLIIRLVIVGVAAANGISFGLAPEVEQTKKDFPDGFMLLASCIALIYMAIMTYASLKWHWKRDVDKNWSEPTWLTNPFSGPLHFFHLGGCFFIGFGLPAFIIRLASGKGIFFETFVLCGGIGVLVGLQRFFKGHQSQVMAIPTEQKPQTAKRKLLGLRVAFAVIPPLCLIAFFVSRWFSIPVNRRVSHEVLSTNFLQAVKSRQWSKAQDTFCSDTKPQLISDIKNKQGKSGVVGSWKFIRREEGRKVNGIWVTPLVYQVTNAQNKSKSVTIQVKFDLFGEGACITGITGL
jgi:hypothetical protein